MLISYNKILFELSTFFAYNPERQERINKNVTTSSTFAYLTQCASCIMITGVERGDFVPVLPVKDIMAFIIASFDGIIRDVTLSKCYAGNSVPESGVALYEKNLIHCLYISTMSLSSIGGVFAKCESGWSILAGKNLIQTRKLPVLSRKPDGGFRDNIRVSVIVYRVSVFVYEKNGKD